MKALYYTGIKGGIKENGIYNNKLGCNLLIINNFYVTKLKQLYNTAVQIIQ